jgi:hypothetical protein
MVAVKSCVSTRNGPDFIGIGMQKAGTGWLYDQLATHHQVTMPPIKEMHFFDRGFNFQKARIRFREMIDGMIEEGQVLTPADFHFFKTALLAGPTFRRERRSFRLVRERDQVALGESLPYLKLWKDDMEWYCSLFNGPGVEFSGDITPGYSSLPDSLVGQIADALPELKIVLVVRHPVDRFWSQIQMQYRSGCVDENSLSNPGFVASLLKQPIINTRSYPSEIYERWSRHFSHTQIGLFAFDKLKDDPTALREEIFSFLALDTDPELVSADPSFNRKALRRRLTMTTEVRQRLELEFAEEIARSRNILGPVAAAW